MKIIKSFAINEIGQRENQEDCIFPNNETIIGKTNFFMICDGMGGHENGEVASHSVCDSFAAYLKPYDQDSIDEKIFDRALAYAYDELDKKDTTPPDAKKPGTTLTFLCLNSTGALMAHIGDSRIYHFRRNADGSTKILYKSQDHSLVNDLLRAKVITSEEAEKHPEKNLVSRIIQAKAKKRHNAEIVKIEDVKSGDLFFLCSDGILEHINDAKLSEIIAANDNTEKIIEIIRTLCEDNSHDNYSAWLLEVGCNEKNEESSEIEKHISKKNEEIAISNSYEKDSDKSKSGKKINWGISIMILLIIIVIAYWFFIGNKINKPSEIQENTNSIQTDSVQTDNKTE